MAIVGIGDAERLFGRLSVNPSVGNGSGPSKLGVPCGNKNDVVVVGWLSCVARNGPFPVGFAEPL
jgi:hypothetical protein